MSETRRARGVERLLLLAALLLGLVTMHTMGHGPTGHDASALPRLAASAAGEQGHQTHQGHQGPQGPHGLTHRQATGGTESGTLAATTAPTVTTALTPHDSHPPSHGAGGPLAVCLAVLSALVVLGGAALLRARRRRAGRLGAGPTGVRWIAWPQPPPGLAVLERVAVLRI
ncbi:hypothetical protein [Streptomyces laurentii]|uniref:hypothetical protein n=1 Tax=Streptomyces laurentii TaxID=39478 RepID=UPI0036CD6437